MPPGRLIVIAAGKAAADMTRAALDHYRPHLDRVSGLVITQAEPTWDPAPLVAMTGGHPLPDADSEKAGRAVLHSLEAAKPGDRVLCLLSGGASALMTVPAGVSLADLQAVSEALLASGTGIGQINTVRSKLCLLKGGGLARAAAPAAVTALLLSDVVGDDPALIGSGPTVADSTGAGAALYVLASLGIEVPAVSARLRKLRTARQPAAAVRADTRVVAGGAASLEAAAGYLTAAGYSSRILTATETGDSAAAATRHAHAARELLRQVTEPVALLSGGETTVRTAGSRGGTGGRNSHFALALACEMWGEPALAALCADTDGLDGNSRAAGAFVTAELYRAGNLEAAREAVRTRNSGGYLAALDHAFVTGPTGTNVNDLRVILLEPT